ncbi:hypothetical protein TVAG_170980 [Trichomonas vaginalis G3]|uniref:Surface antigen BspA-like n=1 Tax=Trichomonas vaginalis (strain ATCC PRA-98 / G3) TaxID=412133 RepID=A2FIN8_TRIV3|nr:ribonuclease inhibitor domain-containing protein [Trichomonas vaginalis G3]EAX95210.1 hypothetical protein TVAG_170980 [Trichomonas vaginalis G3]KAI5506074.1 ribonuclease inhibitor domain-containing protein [Trichomonas vaginalis G3]|eukprot:XP_001308140.1 hypothetical protein [Trichomonas vaginalis G3]
MSKLLIPKTVTSIEGGAFYDSHIDTLEFEKDSQLTSLTTSSLQYIYSQRIILSNSLEEIQSNAIYSNSQHFNISFITPRTKILTIQSNGISDTSIETFAIPSGTTLKANALNPSNSLQSVTISENVHLEDNCFSGCPNIESFFILDNNIHFKDGFLTEGNKLIHISRSTSTSFDASSLSSIYFKR